MFKKVFRRGQVLVLYALMIPIFILFAGVGLDLGWYYLNVSRLQNAADAAAVAGAREIINSNSGKLKDLTPILVQRLPEDNGLTDDGEPRVETSTETETKQDTKESDEGTTITTTETTTTTTTTISKTQLADLNWDDGDTTAKIYTVKNIGTAQDDLIVDDWSLFDSDSKRKVVPDLKLVKVNGDFYYIVKLDENIRHFFMPGWFDSMDAKVVAIAHLVPEDQKQVEKNSTTKTWEEFIAKIRAIINDNVIVGNWEVQDWYKSMELAYERDENGNYVIENKNKVVTYAKDKNGNFILDSNGDKIPDYTHNYAKDNAYTKRFDANIYAGAWNHFQDFFNIFRATGYHKPNSSDPMEIAGDFYRVETITVRDDVNLASDKPYGTNSSVAATSASINYKPGHVYNPEHKEEKNSEHKGVKKTYKDYPKTPEDLYGDVVGYPYEWEYLDSINVDFKPEVKLPDKWNGKDWDVSLEDNSGVTFKYKDWTKPGQSGNVVITEAYIKHMRIHANINFDEPYKERSDLESPYKEELRDRDAEGNLLPDILWGRIESEPMLFDPDALNGYTKYMPGNISGLSSVRQIIINVNSSNYNTGSITYRPVIIFYDGPERYSTEDKTRESKPVILNLGKPFRGVLYAPNSPVVIIGNAKEQFKGFVVAKKYMRLKNDDDFTFGGYRYFNSKDKQWEYFRSVDANGKVTYRDVDGNLKTNRFDSNTYKVAYYYAKDDTKAEKTKYYRTIENETITDNGVEKKTDNAIVLYTDEYGEVQFAEVDSSFKYKYGEYDNFGRTDFTTHKFHLDETSANNMLLSGSK